MVNFFLITKVCWFILYHIVSSLCYPRIQFANKVIKNLLVWGKATIGANDWMIQSPTVRAEAWTLWTPWFQTCFTPTDWIQYWYSQGYQKTGIFTTVVWPTSLLQPNWQTPGISVLTSYQNIDMFSIWLNYMFEIILSQRIQYDKVWINTLLWWEKFTM